MPRRDFASCCALAALFSMLCTIVPATAEEAPKDYAGPFPTQALYDLCSSPQSRDKCNLYIQGLLYGLSVARRMHERKMPVCLPEISTEAARIKILSFINGTTGGHPSNNKDGGDWMAFMALAAGNLCPGGRSDLRKP